ncbi:MAG TPA: AsmA-like C-terminal region-containing protein [Gemmataceae bacterium]|nr:AsmA-like C-terminal region-containing protein [Gemmataceae bacterium]
MKRWRRFFLIILVILVVAVVALELGRRYLLSRRVGAAVAERLEAAYGGRVEVGDVDVGLGGTDIHDLTLYEEGNGAGEEPWAVIKEVRANVSILDLLGGAEPGELTLDGAAVTLRFDRDGRLLTRLPTSRGATGELPAVDIQHGRVTLRQEGRPDLVVSDIDAELRSEGDRLRLTGTLAEPAWGNATLEALLDRKTGEAAVTLKVPRTHVTQDMLSNLPLVSPAVWQEVQAEGDTPVEFTLRSDAKTKGAHYHVALNPEETMVHVAAIDLRAAQAHGRVVIEDGVVKLRDVQGRMAGGTITTSGDLDFRATPQRLDFKVSVDGAEVSRLPPSWLASLPHGVEGILTGQANLQVTLGKAGPRTNGTGQGVIKNARIGGQPAEPIRIELHGNGKGFRLTSLREPGSEGVAPARAGNRDDFFPAWAANRLIAAVVRVIQVTHDTGKAALGLVHQPPPKPGTKPSPRYLEVNLAMHDVNVEEFVRGLNLQLPFPVAGRLSFRLQAAFPLDTPKDAKTYRLDGTAAAPWLTVADLRMQQVRATIAYRDGVLRLTQFRGRAPAAYRPAVGPPASGGFDGTARVQVVPTGDLTAKVTLDEIPLDRVASLVPGTAAQAAGVLSGSVEVQAPSARLKEVTAWFASGSVIARGVRAYGWALDIAATDVRLKEGELTLSGLRGVIQNTPVTGSGHLRLAAPYAYGGKLSLPPSDVASLGRLYPGFQPPVPVDGRIEATADVEGTLSPFTAKMDLRAPQLRVQGIPAERLHGSLDYGMQGVAYRLTGEALGGRFDLDGKLPPAEPRQAEPAPDGHLRIQGARLGRLGPALDPASFLGPLRGLLDLELTFRHQGPDRSPVGSGLVVLRRLRWGTTVLADRLASDLLLTPQELRLRNLAGTLAGGSLRGQAVLNFHSRERSWCSIALDRGEASRLLAPWPVLADNIQGPVDLRLRGTFGKPWMGSGELDLGQGRAWGIEVVDWRLPFDWVLAPRHGRGRVDVHDTVAQMARGRLSGRGRLGWGEGTRLQAQVQLFQLDLESLARQLADSGQTGTGRITGRLDFSGTDVRSWDDVTATLEASLAQTQAFQFPVLNALAPYVFPGQSPAAAGTGEVRARLDRGIIRVQRLALDVRQLPVFIQGTITLQGRLDLDATVNNSRPGQNLILPRLLGDRFSPSAPLPVGILTQATNLLARQLLHFRVTGTVHSPAVRIEPLPLLSEGALRFFLNRRGP